MIEFETALLAREKGYHVAVDSFFTNHKEIAVLEGLKETGLTVDWNILPWETHTPDEYVQCSAPTLGDLHSWLLDKGLRVELKSLGGLDIYGFSLYQRDGDKAIILEEDILQDTYEKSLNLAIRKALAYVV